jgi:hypothetical protein
VEEPVEDVAPTPPVEVDDAPKTPRPSPALLRRAILRFLVGQPQVHRFALLGGRTTERGDLERWLDLDFTPAERALADQAFEALLHGGLIRSRYDDVLDPGNWVSLTPEGVKDATA